MKLIVPSSIPSVTAPEDKLVWNYKDETSAMQTRRRLALFLLASSRKSIVLSTRAYRGWAEPPTSPTDTYTRIREEVPVRARGPWSVHSKHLAISPSHVNGTQS